MRQLPGRWSTDINRCKFYGERGRFTGLLSQPERGYSGGMGRRGAGGRTTHGRRLPGSPVRPGAGHLQRGLCNDPAAHPALHRRARQGHVLPAQGRALVVQVGAGQGLSIRAPRHDRVDAALVRQGVSQYRIHSTRCILHHPRSSRTGWTSTSASRRRTPRAARNGPIRRRHPCNARAVHRPCIRTRSRAVAEQGRVTIINTYWIMFGKSAKICGPGQRSIWIDVTPAKVLFTDGIPIRRRDDPRGNSTSVRSRKSDRGGRDVTAGNVSGFADMTANFSQVSTTANPAGNLSSFISKPTNISMGRARRSAWTSSTCCNRRWPRRPGTVPLPNGDAHRPVQ